jgi:glutamate-1-semialdehyde aminotransferase
MESAYLRNPWFYLPSEGIHWSSSGAHYPLFVREAKGARFYDAESRAYLDYTCGWGACFLGHAEPRIAQAVADSVSRRALSGLPQDIEIELTERLCALFPGPKWRYSERTAPMSRPQRCAWRESFPDVP